MINQQTPELQKKTTKPVDSKPVKSAPRAHRRMSSAGAGAVLAETNGMRF